jgi:hypothetical protein
MNYTWYKASDGTEWTNKTHMDRYEEERQLAKELAPLAGKPMELASWILENFERKGGSDHA